MAIPVKLKVFEGPLDLLLHLIEKNKIDIYDIPIAELTRQYLDYLDKFREFNIGFGIFNLIPLPPLDGSHVLMQLLPRDMAYKLAELERYSFLILIVLLMTPVLSMILIPCRALIWHIFSLLLSPFF